MKDLICVLHINNLLSSGFVDFLKVNYTFPLYKGDCIDLSLASL